MGRRYLRGAAAAARYLGMTPIAIYQLVHRRQIPFSKRGSKLFFDVVDLDRWIQEGKQHAETGERTISGQSAA